MGKDKQIRISEAAHGKIQEISEGTGYSIGQTVDGLLAVADQLQADLAGALTPHNPGLGLEADTYKCDACGAILEEQLDKCPSCGVKLSWVITEDAQGTSWVWLLIVGLGLLYVNGRIKQQAGLQGQRIL